MDLQYHEVTLQVTMQEKQNQLNKDIMYDHSQSIVKKLIGEINKLDDEIIKIFPSEEIDMYMITKYFYYSTDCNQIKVTSYWNSMSFKYDKAKIYFFKNDLILRYNK